MILAGHQNERRCTGVRDPLYARALFLCDRGTPLLIISLDLVGLSLPRVERLRRLLTRDFISSVLMVCTHTHAGPDTLGLWGGTLGGIVVRSGADPDYLSFLDQQIVACAGEAVASARPARLHLAEADFDPSDRFIRNLRGGPIDRCMRLVHLGDERGESIAHLVQHACHPSTLGRENHRISADYCTVLCRRVEAECGGIALFANGALGAAIAPAVLRSASPAERERLCLDLGEALGRHAVELIRQARRTSVPDRTIRLAREDVRFPVRELGTYVWLNAAGVVDRRDLTAGLLSEVTFVRVGPACIAVLPGEAAPALAGEILARLPGNPKLIFSLANDELGYLLPPEYFHDPTYARECALSPGKHAAVRLALALERAVRAVLTRQ